MKTPANGTAALLNAARGYVTERGWALTVVAGKRPVLDEWQKVGRTLDQLADELTAGRAIGRLNGELSRNEIDVDLDAPEAIIAGEVLLPRTPSVWGRQGAERSHWQFVVDPLVPTLQLDDPAPSSGQKARLIELRSTGTQSVVPPSPHPTAGYYRWTLDGDPALVDGRVLAQHVKEVGAAALLGRHWPAEGSRHTAALALAGTLLRGEWHRDESEQFIRAVARAAGDAEEADRIATVSYTEQKLGEGAEVTGLTRLKELIDARVVDRAVAWLGLPEDKGRIFLGGRQIGGPSSEITTEFGPPRASAPARQWPSPMGAAALSGLVGETVAAMEPHTEADPHALLVNLLVAYGCALNAAPHTLVGGTTHTARLFAVLVGTTSRGKKGDSWGIVSRLFKVADPKFHAGCVQEGLSSGEGLISAVRDPQTGLVKGDEVITDPGVSDKRLLVAESEFGRVLAVMKREGNTLSAVLRSAWDHGDLRVMTKTQLRATGAHVCVLGHITPDELVGGLGDLWIANGFANRFLWIAVRRSRPLAWPEPFDGAVLADLAHRWGRALDAGRKVGRMTWATDGRALYEDVYPDLGPERSGIAGSLIARGAPCVLRLAMTYALVDGSSRIGEDHLRAALEVWGYSERTVDYVWGETTGDPISDVILKELREQQEMSRTDISALFSRNESKHVIDAALDRLLSLGLAESRRRLSGGRPLEIWSVLGRE